MSSRPDGALRRKHEGGFRILPHLRCLSGPWCLVHYDWSISTLASHRLLDSGDMSPGCLMSGDATVPTHITLE